MATKAVNKLFAVKDHSFRVFRIPEGYHGYLHNNSFFMRRLYQSMFDDYCPDFGLFVYAVVYMQEIRAVRQISNIELYDTAFCTSVANLCALHVIQA